MRHDLRRIIQIKRHFAPFGFIAQKGHNLLLVKVHLQPKVRFIESSAPFRTLETAYLILSSTHRHQMNKTSRDPTSRFSETGVCPMVNRKQISDKIGKKTSEKRGRNATL